MNDNEPITGYDVMTDIGDRRLHNSSPTDCFMRCQRDELKAEIERLKRTLDFYADEHALRAEIDRLWTDIESLLQRISWLEALNARNL